MAESRTIQIADAIAVLITNAAITPAIPAEPAVVATRDYLPEYELPDLKTAKVAVVPATITAELVGRNSHEFGYAVDVALHRRVKDTAETDAMMRVAEQLLDLLRSTPITIAGLGVLIPTVLTNDPIYAPEVLREKRTFLSVLRVTYPAGVEMT